jgi:hypothetical protein
MLKLITTLYSEPYFETDRTFEVWSVSQLDERINIFLSVARWGITQISVAQLLNFGGRFLTRYLFIYKSYYLIY